MIEETELTINEEKTAIEFKVTMDTTISSVKEYEEISTTRIALCNKAAEKLGLQFHIIINGQQLI